MGASVCGASRGEGLDWVSRVSDSAISECLGSSSSVPAWDFSISADSIWPTIFLIYPTCIEVHPDNVKCLSECNDLLKKFETPGPCVGG
jgi:hypothetical protein